MSRPAACRGPLAGARSRRSRRPDPTAATTAASSSMRITSPRPIATGAPETRIGRNPETHLTGAPRHSSAGIRASGAPSTEYAARRRLVHLREQLDQRRLARAVLADDGDDRARRQRQRHIVEHQPRRARVGERHVVETDAVAQSIRHRTIGRRRSATPRSPRATRDDASRPSRSRAGSRSRRRWRRCTPTAASPAASTSSTSPGGRPARDETKTIAPTYAPPKTAQASVCHSRRCPARRRHGSDTSAPRPRRRCATRRSPMPVTRTSLPGGAVVAS